MSRIVDWVKGAEPALVVGAVAAGLVAVQEALQNGSVVSWHVLVPVFVAAVIRQFVTPTLKARRQQDAAVAEVHVQAADEHERFVIGVHELAIEAHQQASEPPEGW